MLRSSSQSGHILARGPRALSPGVNYFGQLKAVGVSARACQIGPQVISHTTNPGFNRDGGVQRIATRLQRPRLSLGAFFPDQYVAPGDNCRDYHNNGVKLDEGCDYTEAMKLAFADREHFYGDPNHVEVPLATLLSEDYNAERPYQGIGNRVLQRRLGPRSTSVGQVECREPNACDRYGHVRRVGREPPEGVAEVGSRPFVQ